MSKFGELISAQVPVLIDFTQIGMSRLFMHPVIRDVAAAR
jgi:thioredoxin 1